MKKRKEWNERDREVLLNLWDCATDKYATGRVLVWVRPMDIGGRDGSHHASTLNRLVRRGLVEKRRRAGHSRPSYLYKLTDEGKQRIAAILGESDG